MRALLTWSRIRFTDPPPHMKCMTAWIGKRSGWETISGCTTIRAVIILTIGKDFVTVAEGNFNSSIHWGRRISMDDLEEAFIYRETVSR